MVKIIDARGTARFGVSETVLCFPLLDVEKVVIRFKVTKKRIKSL